MVLTSPVADRPADPAGRGAPALVPDLSLVMPCYNEADCLPLTVPPLVAAFARAQVALQLILVDNGSTDATSRVIDELIAAGLPITKGRVARNEGQGLGIITGLALCRGRFVGYQPADGQTNPEAVVEIYRRLAEAPVPSMAKARRRVRSEGPMRVVVSIVYNAVMHLAFPGTPSRDINCSPKLMPAGILRLIEPASKDWFLEAEIMLKARHLRLPVIEVDTVSVAREAGSSHVRLATVLEFLRNIITYRFSPEWRAWRDRVTHDSVLSPRY